MALPGRTLYRCFMTTVPVPDAPLAEPVAMRSDVAPAGVAADLHRARALLLAGRGPGASEAEVASHTRNRVEIAGVTVTRRRELAARQTAVARGDTDGLTSVIQLSRAELADAVIELRSRLDPWRLGRIAATRLIAQLRAHPAPLVVLGVAAVALRGRRPAMRGEGAGRAS